MSRIATFWAAARAAAPELPEDPPAADRIWGFGATPEHADSLLALVLAGVKTGTASYLWEYEAEGEPLPAAGEYDIILDGSGHPRAVTVTNSVEVVPFDEVTDEHARAEGEDDRSLESWRRIHRDFYEQHVDLARPFASDMPMVCERFRVVFAG
ncbi:RNA-binding protein [Microbacterium sorbitolivorans]|uniref:ASCH domain-containing protein n=1 Tax=Microbacterium sorbitolivorans TaxID=1867410 RepID=A0A367Y2Z7_9MICO|nr:ASCH domain-containing protein [Microbacterium sorbitolivorans]RCK59910.1 ASCH domain-containing protein [Microbacterium sorbitolivorans]GGF41082.1 RNA-binding protein [Microbacterium sorbitolivorans]